MMKSFMKIVVPVIMSLSLIMILSTTSYSGYGQPVSNTTTTTTTIGNTTAPDTSNQTNQNVSQLAQEDLTKQNHTYNPRQIKLILHPILQIC